MADRVASLRGADAPKQLAPSSPLELEIPEKVLTTVSNHMGISKEQVKREYDMICLGELKVVAHRERNPSLDATEVVPAESVAHETVDGHKLGPEARAVHCWEAGLLFAEYLREHGRPVLSGRNVVEVGAGVGLVGFAAAEVAPSAKVCLTDGNDTAVSLMHTNRELNAAWFGPDAANTVHVRTMRWDDVQAVKDTVAMYGPFDTIIGADVVYNRKSAEALVALLPQLIKDHGIPANSPVQPLILIAHEVRHGAHGKDDALAAFLTPLCDPGAGAKAKWSIVAQRIVKEGETIYEATNPTNIDVSKISNMPRTESGTAISASAAMAAQTGQPTPAGAAGGGLSIVKPASKPSLAVDSHIRALPLAAPQHHGADVAAGVIEPTAAELITQAVTQPHGSYLLLELSPAV